MNRSKVLLTDSGGVQEEGPSLGEPVLMRRGNTERPEAVDAGRVRLVGTDPDRIVHECSTLPTDDVADQRMARAVNPHGDGRSTERTLDATARMIGRETHVEEFFPATA